MAFARERGRILTFAVAALLIFGALFAQTEPAYADDEPLSETVSDGIVTMTATYDDIYGNGWDNFRIDITIDGTGLSFDDGQVVDIVLDCDGMYNAASPTTEPKVSIDGGPEIALSDYWNCPVHYRGSIAGLELRDTMDASAIAGHKVMISTWHVGYATYRMRASQCHVFTLDIPESSTHPAASYTTDIDF